MKIGRNDPCPCGSGLKYKKCCADKLEEDAPSTAQEEFREQLRELLREKHFSSVEEARAFISGYFENYNKTPMDDLLGLTPNQMHRVLYLPFDSPELVTFPSPLDIEPAAPITTLFTLLTEAIGENGLKGTATGNLPRNFCREAAISFLGEEGYGERTRFGGINTEPDFPELHVTRIVGELAGLVRKYKGKFILSRECRNLLTGEGMSAIYPRLFRAFALEYNWGYQDRYPDFSIIQQSFAFTLYLLERFGTEWQPSSFYAERFIQAFPAVLREAQPLHFETAEDEVGRCYILRALERFAHFFGLAEIERTPAELYTTKFRIRKLPLLDHVVRFHL